MRTRTLPPQLGCRSPRYLGNFAPGFRCRRALFRPYRLHPDRARRAHHIPAVAIGQPAREVDWQSGIGAFVRSNSIHHRWRG